MFVCYDSTAAIKILYSKTYQDNPQSSEFFIISEQCPTVLEDQKFSMAGYTGDEGRDL